MGGTPLRHAAFGALAAACALVMAASSSSACAAVVPGSPSASTACGAEPPAAPMEGLPGATQETPKRVIVEAPLSDKLVLDVFGDQSVLTNLVSQERHVLQGRYQLRFSDDGYQAVLVSLHGEDDEVVHPENILQQTVFVDEATGVAGRVRSIYTGDAPELIVSFSFCCALRN